MPRITGFEFDVEGTTSTRRWCQLWGSGGLMGDGCLASAYDNRSDAVLSQLLSRAQSQTELRDSELRPINAVAVHAVRPILVAT